MEKSLNLSGAFGGDASREGIDVIVRVGLAKKGQEYPGPAGLFSAWLSGAHVEGPNEMEFSGERSESAATTG